MSIKEKGFGIQCLECLRLLGISSKDFLGEEIYCLRCAKQKTAIKHGGKK